MQPVDPASDETHEVYLSAPTGCPCYVGRVIDNIDELPDSGMDGRAFTPGGIRSIDAIVDITNYVMLSSVNPCMRLIAIN